MKWIHTADYVNQSSKGFEYTHCWMHGVRVRVSQSSPASFLQSSSIQLQSLFSLVLFNSNFLVAYALTEDYYCILYFIVISLLMVRKHGIRCSPFPNCVYVFLPWQRNNFAQGSNFQCIFSFLFPVFRHFGLSKNKYTSFNELKIDSEDLMKSSKSFTSFTLALAAFHRKLVT